MICANCRGAGKLNAQANAVDKVVPGSVVVESMRDRAAEAHSECPGGTWCDCQHKLGGVVRADRRQPR